MDTEGKQTQSVFNKTGFIGLFYTSIVFLKYSSYLSSADVGLYIRDGHKHSLSFDSTSVISLCNIKLYNLYKTHYFLLKTLLWFIRNEKT